MIIVNLIGGLGNQMFQYACGLALATRLKMPLKAAIDMFDNYKLHNGIELQKVFDLKLQVAQSAELRRMLGAFRATRIARRVLGIKLMSPLRAKYMIVEPDFSYYHDLIDRANNGAYLQGYWQSERYFSKHESIIRKNFTFKSPLNEHNIRISDAITNSTAVSIHVRRGDYVNNPKTFAKHGACSPEYYFKAMKLIRTRIPDTRFFAFSDDPQWIHDTLRPKYPDLQIVENNKNENSYIDMHLMSLCKHHIIANSSFSWWGAWLNQNPDKIVIAPRCWFANGESYGDILPDSYICL